MVGYQKKLGIGLINTNTKTEIMSLKTGDIVQLNSGGPEMTVKGILGDTNNPLSKMENTALKMAGHEDGDVYCQWFFNNKLESGIFKPTTLKKI